MDFWKNLTPCIVILIFFLSGNQSQDLSQYNKLNNTEQVVTAGLNWTFTCTGNGTLKWIIPLYLKRENVTTSQIQTSNNLYEASLNLYNVSFEHIGNYTCIYDTTYTNQSAKNYISRFYVFVDNLPELIATRKTDIYAKQKSRVIVPCRPTAPNVDIKLGYNGEEFDPLKTLPDYLTYNRKEGFTFTTGRNDTDFNCECSASRNGADERKTFYVHLQSPKVELFSPTVYMKGTKPNIMCKATGFPLPSVSWSYVHCESKESSDLTEPIELKDFRSRSDEDMVNSTLNLPTDDCGKIVCLAQNKVGTTNSSRIIYAVEIEDGFGIIAENNIFGVGDATQLTCVISKFVDYSNNINWYKLPGEELITAENNDGYILTNNITELSNHLTLIIDDLNKLHEGDYMCKHTTEDGVALESRTITLFVNEIVSPEIISTNLNNSVAEFFIGEQNITLFCEASGYPLPTITWNKGHRKELIIEDDRIQVVNDGRALHFNYVRLEDGNRYECVAENKKGTVSKSIQLKLKDLPQSIGTIVAISVVFFLTTFLIIGFLIVKIKREKQLRAYICNMGINYFEMGALDAINPDLGIDEQAELLPYDKRWEFPRENLRLGKQLGSGAFGVVLKGAAKNIVDGEECTKVAVKTVKTTADPIFIKNLVSELKILIHLGKHVNIVNLLGACTKNIINREFFVIVEYCRHGNLHNYLRRRREKFIDQINQDGEFDFKITSNELISELQCNSPAPITENSGNPGIMRSDSVQPEWRFNFRADYKYLQLNTHVTSQDLLIWALQIAMGLDFLASRKVIHGDLATRNILLTDNNIIKICDFGLAKRMYKSYNYKTKSNGPLPIKWLAIETIRDRIFSTQSDVWAYGIVLWELFSLASAPYPEMQADEHFYQKLFEGYRMRKPMYANKRVYEIMVECWRSNPMFRPTFKDLVNKIGTLLDGETFKHFVNLNEPYLQMNKKQLSENDYLAAMTAPNYENYVCMSAKQDYVNAPNGGSSLINPYSPEDIDSSGRVVINMNNEEAGSNPVMAFNNAAYFTNDQLPMHPDMLNLMGYSSPRASKVSDHPKEST